MCTTRAFKRNRSGPVVQKSKSHDAFRHARAAFRDGTLFLMGVNALQITITIMCDTALNVIARRRRRRSFRRSDDPIARDGQADHRRRYVDVYSGYARTVRATTTRHRRTICTLDRFVPVVAVGSTNLVPLRLLSHAVIYIIVCVTVVVFVFQTRCTL